MKLIEINPEYGLAYVDDFAGIRAMLKDTKQMDALIDGVESSILCEELDPTKPEDALRIRANVAFAKKVKTRLEKIRTEAVADLKKEPKKVEDAVRPYVKRLETLAETIGKPLAEMDARADRLRIIADRPNILSAAPIHQLEQELATAQAMTTEEAEWKERTKEAELVKIGLVEALEVLLAKRKQDEADRLELDRLRAEKAEKEMRERIERETRERLEREAADEARAKRAAAEAVDAEEVAKVKPVQAAQPTESPYQQAYQDIRAVIAKNGFGDLAAAFLAAATAGKIRHISTHL